MSISEAKQASLIAKMVSDGNLSPYQALTNSNVPESVRNTVGNILAGKAESIDITGIHELELVPNDDDLNAGKSFPKSNVINKIENVVEKTGWAGRAAVAGVSIVASLSAAAVEADSLDEFGDNILDDAQENRYVSAAIEGDNFKLAEMGAKDIAIAAAGAAAGAVAMTVAAPAIVVGALAVGGAVVAGIAVEKGIDYLQDVNLVEVGENIDGAIQTSMTAIDTLGGQMKGGALAIVDDVQELAGDVSDSMEGAFDDLKDDYQQAGGITGMFNSAVNSVQSTLSNTFNISAENNVAATIEHQPINPGMG